MRQWDREQWPVTFLFVYVLVIHAHCAFGYIACKLRAGGRLDECENASVGLRAMASYILVRLRPCDPCTLEPSAPLPVNYVRAVAWRSARIRQWDCEQWPNTFLFLYVPVIHAHYDFGYIVCQLRAGGRLVGCENTSKGLRAMSGAKPKG